MTTPLTAIDLGNSGLKTAGISLGTVKLGRSTQVKYPTAVKIPSDKDAQEILDTAQNLGINLIDTAPAYGNSEQRLGKLLAGRQRHWQICTKVGEEFDGENSHYDFTPEHTKYSIERSLQRLNVEVLDLVLIHSNGEDQSILKEYGTLECLIALKQAGKIRAVGISHKTVAGGELAVQQGADVIMATLNKDYLAEQNLIASAAQAGVGVLIKKALRSGHGDSTDLAWVSRQAGVHSIVVGTTNPTHLIENTQLVSQI